MGRYLGPKCRLCRREGIQLFLKGTRCFSVKCALVKRKNPPGVLAKKRTSKLSNFGVEMREKQKLKRMYGCLGEKQFYIDFHHSERKTGKTSDNLILALERRFDNVLLRSHFASSRFQAQQLISHGHFQINGRKVDIPSYRVQPNDVISAREKSKNLSVIRESLKNLSKQGVASWLEIDENEVTCKILDQPKKEEITLPLNEQLVVEFYSK